LGLGVPVRARERPGIRGRILTAADPAAAVRSDCAECHRTPDGLGEPRDVKTLAGSCREHDHHQPTPPIAAPTCPGCGTARRTYATAPAPARPTRAQRAGLIGQPSATAEAASEDGRAARKPPIPGRPAAQRNVDLSVTRKLRSGLLRRPRPPGSVARVTGATAATGGETAYASADPLSRLRPMYVSVCSVTKAPSRSREVDAAEVPQAPGQGKTPRRRRPMRRPPTAKAEASRRNNRRRGRRKPPRASSRKAVGLAHDTVALARRRPVAAFRPRRRPPARRHR